MADIPRGKRRLARRAFTGWCVFSIGTAAAIVFGDMEAYEVDALVSVHFIVTSVSGTLIFGLMGIDAVPSQIIPAWKGEE